MVRLKVGDRVCLVKPYESCMLSRGKLYGKRLINKANSIGTIHRENRGSVVVQWDVAYRGMVNSGFRKPMRFELCEGPW